MKLTQPVLNTALRGLRLVKPRRASLPVLDCVHLSADGPTVALSVTDLDQSLTFTGELAEPSNRLTRLVPLAILQRVAREMPKEAVFSFEKPGQIICCLLYTSLIQGGYLESERLVNMSKQNYRLEPNPSFTPDMKFIVFRSNMFGPDYAFAVEVAKAKGP